MHAVQLFALCMLQHDKNLHIEATLCIYFVDFKIRGGDLRFENEVSTSIL